MNNPPVAVGSASHHVHQDDLHAEQLGVVAVWQGQQEQGRLQLNAAVKDEIHEFDESHERLVAKITTATGKRAESCDSSGMC